MRQSHIYLVVGMLMPTIVFAQTDAGQLQKQIEKQLPELNALPMPGPSKEPQKPAESRPDDVKILVKGFKFEGVKLLSEQVLIDALRPWIGKEVTLVELQNAAAAVAEVYRKNNFLAQAVLPPQKIGEDGIVLVSVLEAKLGAVKVDAEVNEPRFPKEKVIQYMTYQNKIGEDINTQAIERAVYILNEIPGVSVTTSLEPGEKDGEVALKVNVSDTALFNGRVQAANYGSRSTGVEQITSSLSFNNPQGYGDQILMNLVASSGSQYGQLAYSLPVDPSGLRLMLTTSYLNYKTENQFAGAEGYSYTFGGSLSYPLLRSQSTNLNLTGGIDQKSYRNKSSLTDLPTSYYDLTVFNIGLSGNHFDSLYGAGITSASVTLSHGNISVKEPTNYGVQNGKRYSKVAGNIGRNQQVQPDVSVLNATLNFQFASTNLDSAEKFYLGGPNGVRAYPSSQGSGDHGLLLSVEYQHQLPDRYVAYAFYDYGLVQQYKNPDLYRSELTSTHAKNSYSLSGVGLGLKYIYSGVSFNAAVALRLGDNPLYRYSGGQYIPMNSDGTARKTYFWIQANYPFN